MNGSSEACDTLIKFNNYKQLLLIAHDPAGDRELYLLSGYGWAQSSVLAHINHGNLAAHTGTWVWADSHFAFLSCTTGQKPCQYLAFPFAYSIVSHYQLFWLYSVLLNNFTAKLVPPNTSWHICTWRENLPLVLLEEWQKTKRTQLYFTSFAF